MSLIFFHICNWAQVLVEYQFVHVYNSVFKTA